MKLSDKQLDMLSIIFAVATAGILVLTIFLTTGRKSSPVLTFTHEQLALIGSADSLMRVLTTEDSLDVEILRRPSDTLSADDIKSDAFKKLSRLMISTVTAPEHDGVGIAGPQVGINKRVVAVQRFDKEGEPFEIYPNIRIEEFYGGTVPGDEGCLSVPGKRASVQRYRKIAVSYTDSTTLKTVTDTISGFTAVIFQHETDHLDGILYTDKAETVRVKADLDN